MSPIAIYCFEDKEIIHVVAKVLSQDGQKKIYKKIESCKAQLKEDILVLANDFIAQGSNSMILQWW